MADSVAKKRRLLDTDFLRKLERLALITKRVRPGTSKGERKSPRKGSSAEFADYRDYVQGDDLRHVDWNLFGRLDALYLKLFQEQEDLTLHLLLDGSSSMAFGIPPKIDLACRLAAAVGYIALTKYDRLSVEVFSGENAQRLPISRGRAAANRLFSFLEDVQCSGVTKLEADYRRYVQRRPQKGIIVLFSDFFDPAGPESVLKRMSIPGMDCYVVHILSRDDIAPSVSGDLRLIDSETMTHTEISTTRWLLERYQASLEAFCESIRHACTARNCAYVPAISDMDFEKLTLGILRRSGLMR